MTATTLLTAVLIGLVLGFAARLLNGRVRELPVWLPPVAGVGAAVLAGWMAGLAHHDGPAPLGTEIAVQVIFALAGIVAVTAADGRRSSERRRSGAAPHP